MSKREAGRIFARVMDARAERIAIFQELLAVNGIRTSDADESVERMSAWIVHEVTADEELTSRPAWPWLGVAFDAGLWLGELLIARAPGLEWKFNDFDRNARSFRRHVILGFHSPDKTYYEAPDFVVADAMDAAVQGNRNPRKIARWFEAVLQYEMAYRKGETPSLRR